MANFNSGYMFNANAKNGGFFWNGAKFVLFIRLNEVLKFSTDATIALAKLVLLEMPEMVEEGIVQTALLKQTDKIHTVEEATYSRLFEITESLGITDEFASLLVLASLYEKVDILEQARMMAAILETEEVFSADEEITVESFLTTIEQFGFEELSKIAAVILSMHDTFGLTDSEPRQAVSDFIIGVSDELDHAYDWLIPFGMKVDWNTTNISVMPEASNTVIEMPGIDGSIVEDTVYKDRLFQIVAYSEDGLTIQQKENLKARIAEILDATKHKTKKLTVQARSTSFDVKYDGQANITDGPSYVKATIPLRTGPYGYDMFENELRGIGLVINDGEAPCGVRHIISGPISNPSFSLGDVTYKWSGTVPNGSNLVIDHGMMTCYIVNENGIKTNGMANLSGRMQKIPAHTSVVLNAESTVASHIMTEWKNKVLW